MGRVDDALRRAAEAGDTRPALPEPSEPGADVFPVEMPTARGREQAGAGRTGQQSLTASVPPPPSALDESPSMFEQRELRMGEKFVIDQRMSPGCREQYRRLAAVLHDAQATRGTQVVMVASAVAGEGKTLTVANLALTLSNSYRKRVLVIDGDLRRPTLHQVFKIDTSFGLTDGLDPTTEAKMVVRQVTPTLSVLPAGRPTNDPMAGLISDRMRRLIDEARETFDWVLVDTPPLVLLPDANLLSSMTDGAVIVVRAESTPHSLVKRATDAIGRNRVLGVVLNGATATPHGGYDSYRDYYAPVEATRT